MTDAKATIKRTGEMMLGGWKLLSTVCPICHSALMSKAKEMRCPGCNLPVKTEGSASTTASPGFLPTNTDAQAKPNPVNEPTSFEELKKEYDLKNKNMQQVSNKLGERMLSGWTMLGIVCPSSLCRGTPLVSHEGKRMHCVCCEKDFETYEDGELYEYGKNQENKEIIRSEVPVLTVDPETEEFSGSLNLIDSFHIDQASEKIGKYLLQGWAMLSECCDNKGCDGNVPLLRDKNKKIYCVNCGYINEALKNAPSRAEEDVDDSDDDLDDEIVDKYIEKRKADFVSRKPMQEGTSANSVSDCNVESMLKKKLISTARELENSTSIDLSLKLAELITKLGEAIKSTESIRI